LRVLSMGLIHSYIARYEYRIWHKHPLHENAWARK
jgi:hypothetical protein